MRDLAPSGDRSSESPPGETKAEYSNRHLNRWRAQRNGGRKGAKIGCLRQQRWKLEFAMRDRDFGEVTFIESVGHNVVGH